MKLLLALALAPLLFLGTPRAAANEIPPWFAETFLDVREDAADAAKAGKRLVYYFWLEGCPYCERMEQVSFRDPAIVAGMKREFVAVAINVRGDREVTWTGGERLTEKTLTQKLAIRGTPTLVFFDEKGGVALRATGYLDPAQLAATLERARAPRSASR